MNLIEKIKLNLKALRSVLGKEKDIIQETQDSQLNKGKPILHKSVETLNTKIDDYSYVSNNSIIHNCKIGKFCSIGPNVVIGFGEHPTSFISTSPLFMPQMRVCLIQIYIPQTVLFKTMLKK